MIFWGLCFGNVQPDKGAPVAILTGADITVKPKQVYLLLKKHTVETDLSIVVMLIRAGYLL